MGMRYRTRTIILILIWIILAVIMTAQTIYYGYARSVETTHQTVKGTLLKVKENFADLVDNEITLRDSYDTANMRMGLMIPLLQHYGLEEDVPESKHLKKYAELLGAEYIAIKDKKGKTLTSYGEYFEDKEDIPINTREDMVEWLTSGDSLISAAKDHTNYEMPLSDDKTLLYQTHNKEINQVQNEAFSWRAILNNLSLPGDAQLVVISKKDDTILIHPKNKLIGKSYQALGYHSRAEFYNNYKAPDRDGIAYHRGFVQVLLETAGDTDTLANVFASRIGSGYIDCGNVLVLCLVNQETFYYHLVQERGLLAIYAFGSLLVLCYIIFRFHQQRRIRQEAQKNGQDPFDVEPDRRSIKSHLGFCYERDWSRRLAVCCLLVLLVSTFSSIHIELLNNSSQMRIQAEQAKELRKTMKRENEQHRQMLDEWYNHTSIKMANVISYVVTRDERLQSRKTMKKIAEVFGVREVTLYSQNGKTRVTNSDYDHVDLYDNPDSRLSRTLLPLLEGMKANASTPITKLNDQDDADQKETEDKSALEEDVLGNMAFAGASIRNAQDLCDGCLGIITEPVAELWGNKGTISLEGDTYDTILNLASVEEEQLNVPILGVSQIRLIISMLRLLLLCLALFWCIGTLKRSRRVLITAPDPEETHHPEEEQNPEMFDGMDAMGKTEEKTEESAENDGSGEEKKGPRIHSEREKEDLFYSIFGKERDYYFNERWNFDDTPFFRRSPERQLFSVIKCLLVLLGIQIMWMFLIKGNTLNVNSTIRDVINGGWKQGPNLYAFTASEMVIIVIYVICLALHRLVYFVARFSTPRVETVCHLVYSTINYAGVFVGLYYCLTFFGVHARTMLAGAGILGIVISFGAQSTIADILSGMFLIFEDVIHVGDYIKVGNTYGVIKNIGVRMTKLQYFGTTISINNSDLKPMENLSAADARVSSYLTLDASENLQRAEEIIERELPGITARMSETGYLTSDVWYSDVDSSDKNGIVLRFNVFCVSYQYTTVTRTLNAELIKMAQNNNIRIAYRHSFLMTDGPAGEEASSESEDA